MDKLTIFAISSYNKNYFFDEKCTTLPNNIKSEIKLIGKYFVNKVGGNFMLSFYENCNISLEYSFLDNDFNFDEIGAKLEIKKIKSENKKLFNELTLWYKIFRIGEKVK